VAKREQRGAYVGKAKECSEISEQLTGEGKLVPTFLVSLGMGISKSIAQHLDISASVNQGHVPQRGVSRPLVDYMEP